MLTPLPFVQHLFARVVEALVHVQNEVLRWIEHLPGAAVDAMENYKKYDRKKVKFLALVYNPDKLKKGVFVPGRFAMTCCIEDVTFIGFKCKYDREEELPHKSWITITAEIRVEFAREYKGKGPVLYPVSIEKAQKPEDELVYFS